MLVCNVSMRPRGHAIAADMVEAGAAADDLGGGQLVIGTLVDDPASVNEIVDAYLGEIMLEAASATDVFSLVNIYDAAVNETITPTDATDASMAVAFATWNPADLSGVTLSGSNLIATSTAGVSGIRGNSSRSSGKSYWEYTYTTINTNGLAVGVGTSSFNLTGGTTTNAAVVIRLNGPIQINNSASGSQIGTINPGNVIGVAVDFTAHLIWFRIAPSGNWNGSGTANPATGVGGLNISALSGALFPLFTGGSGDVCTANFGASAFNGSVPSGFNSGF